MSQPYHDVDNSLWSRPPINTCNYGCSFSRKTLQELVVHKQCKMLKHNTTSLYDGGCILVWARRKDFIIFQNSWNCGLFITKNKLLHALGRFLGRTTNMYCDIHMCQEGINLGDIKCMVSIWLHPIVIHNTIYFGSISLNVLLSKWCRRHKCLASSNCHKV